ncbi:MAG: pseudouridine synthase [Bacillota bacterium]
MAGERLDKVLAHMGLGTRKEVRALIKSGAVTVDGLPVADPGLHVDSASSRVECRGRLLEYRRHRYIMLNKPAGVVSATEDRRDRTVMDLLPAELRRPGLFPVGRLDRDTEGLLLLTDNGELAHRLLAPRKHVDKTYLARVEGALTSSDIKAFADGVVLHDGYRTLPARLHPLRAGQESEAEVTIREGKFHQVKRMFLALGKPVIFLKRLRMGPLHLDPSLRPGQARELRPDEVIALLAATGLAQE